VKRVSGHATATEIHIQASTKVIPQTGANGSTTPRTGQVLISLDPAQTRAAFRRTLTTWLLVTLAHEVDHSVRIQAGSGFGLTLLEDFISEGMWFDFDIEVEPTIRLPWVYALTRGEERTMWNRARPLLSETGRGLYDQWFFGGRGVPCGPDFRSDTTSSVTTLARHPHTTAASIVDQPAAVISPAATTRPERAVSPRLHSLPPNGPKAKRPAGCLFCVLRGPTRGRDVA
jgi:hypothetical protein